jgi:hypothetical protein
MEGRKNNILPTTYCIKRWIWRRGYRRYKKCNGEAEICGHKRVLQYVEVAETGKVNCEDVRERGVEGVEGTGNVRDAIL